MILVDSNEPPDFDMLLSQLGIETERGSFNKTAGSPLQWGDFTIKTDEIVTVERKQAVEAMADLDAVESQLMLTLVTCPKVVFVYEGVLAPHPDGTYAGDVHRIEHRTGRGGNEYDELTSRGRIIHQPYVRWESMQYKLQSAGIPVVGTGTIQGTAQFLAHLHKNPSNNLFTRLISTRQAISETDWELREWLLDLMRYTGEQNARAIANVIPNMTQLVAFLAEGGKLAELVLPSGRKLGPALEKKLRARLGVPAC